MRSTMRFAALVLFGGLATPASAEDIDQQTREQIEAVHMKWLDAINKGDVDALSTTVSPQTVQIDVFGRQNGVSAGFVQSQHRMGIVLSMPIEGVRALKGGQAAMAYGTFTAKYADPNVPPGQGNWFQVFEREDDGWKIVAHASSRSALAAQTK